MSEFDRIKSTVKSVIGDFCQINDPEFDLDAPLDDLEIELLSEAVAQALTKGTPHENKS